MLVSISLSVPLAQNLLSCGVSHPQCNLDLRCHPQFPCHTIAGESAGVCRQVLGLAVPAVPWAQVGCERCLSRTTSHPWFLGHLSPASVFANRSEKATESSNSPSWW